MDLQREHFARLLSAHHQLLLLVIGFQRRQRTDYTTISYAAALKKTRCASIETTIRKRRLVFAWAVPRQNEGRLPRRVMLGKMTSGEGRRPGGQPKSFHGTHQVGFGGEGHRVDRCSQGVGSSDGSSFTTQIKIQNGPVAVQLGCVALLGTGSPQTFNTHAVEGMKRAGAASAPANATPH